MRTVTLSAVKAGITRLRIKGGANPDSLYDLLNGRITAQRTIVIRDGSIEDATLPAGTKGLTAFDGKLVFFASQIETPPSAAYRCQVLIHPTDDTQDLAEIHFAEPFAGALYVVAEFANGDIFHYWLENSRTWAASTVFLDGQLVQPTTENGLAYKATRLGPAYPAWQGSIAVAVGDKVEPSTYTGYYYEATTVTGTNTITGATEPTWPTQEGQTVIESADSEAVTVTTPGTPGLPGDGVPGGTDIDPYCVTEDSWLDESVQAKYFLPGMLADCHRPEHGFFADPCLAVSERELRACVRVTTATAVWEGTADTLVNHADATADLAPGMYSLAKDLLAQNVLVEDDIETVLKVEDIGMQWVVRLSFGGASFAASAVRFGRRLFTHNTRVMK